MPLYIDRVGSVLSEHTDALKQIEAQTQRDLDALRVSLEQFADMDYASVEEAIKAIR